VGLGDSGSFAQLSPLVLELLPWQEVGSAFTAVCPSWRDLTKAPGVWAAKHAQHFGWASERMTAGGVAVASAAAFRELRRVQTETLAGCSVDMLGQWLGKDESQRGAVYHFRLTVRADEEGTQLWRGMSEEAPFHNDYRALADEHIDAMSRWPAEQRCSNGSSAAEACRARGIQLDGSERPVGGYIQWFVGENSDPAMLRRMQEHARAQSGIHTILQRRSLEYVSGLFLPALRRLVLAGSHLSRTGFGVLGLDQYDLTLAPDGISLEGMTRGDHSPRPGQWMNELRAESVVLPSSPGSDFRAGSCKRDFDELRRHDP